MFVFLEQLVHQKKIETDDDKKSSEDKNKTVIVNFIE